MICIGRNYAAHAREMGKNPDREAPFFFTKWADALVANGAIKQDADIADLIWDCADTIAHVSRFERLMPGDLIYTGTPAGVGAVVPGDVIDAHS